MTPMTIASYHVTDGYAEFGFLDGKWKHGTAKAIADTQEACLDAAYQWLRERLQEGSGNRAVLRALPLAEQDFDTKEWHSHIRAAVEIETAASASIGGA